MSPAAIRRWTLVHKWTSLVSTAFLFMLCVTGLPLIFHHEINALTGAPILTERRGAGVEPGGGVKFDRIVAQAVATRPGWTMMFLTFDDEQPIVRAVVAPNMRAEQREVAILPFDLRAGTLIAAPPPNKGVMAILLDLHAHLLMGVPGELFLGLIGIVILVAIASGVVVYAPFMRKLPFATIRRSRSVRVTWLDTHNMTGIVGAAWLSAVSLTGFIICMTMPITAIWQKDQLTAMAAPYRQSRPPQHLASVDRVVAELRRAAPDADIAFISWPGSRLSTPHHFMAGLRGNSPLTRRLVKPAMIDAVNAKVTGMPNLPWYMKALFLSAPLHFGDYGGLPLKIIWALLDVAAIVVLGTGLYLWLKPGRSAKNTRPYLRGAQP
ncbi:PepSY-associated TM helix domain-containing protein [Sphingomonas sp.]|uniref:PepSY-associated TM helix domain-containing protein n=1 Tax=Sphingomonas sp. TaxID=28214 RepID=UPI0031E08A6D